MITLSYCICHDEWVRDLSATRYKERFEARTFVSGRLNPLEVYDEVEVKGLFRFQIEHIQNITAELSEGFPFGL